MLKTVKVQLQSKESDKVKVNLNSENPLTLNREYKLYDTVVFDNMIMINNVITSCRGLRINDMGNGHYSLSLFHGSETEPHLSTTIFDCSNTYVSIIEGATQVKIEINTYWD